MKYYFNLLSLIFILPFCYAAADEIDHLPFVIHAIPKCGTHCIIRAINLLTDKQISHCCILKEKNLFQAQKNNQILKIFDSYSNKKMQLLMKNQHKVVSMYRDPRDALVSHVFYMRKFKGKERKRDFFWVSKDFDSLSFDDQLTALITGKDDMQSYLALFKSRMGWVKDPYSLPIRYEDLVGSQGGGNSKKQKRALVAIAKYLGMTLSNEKLQYVINNIYHAEDSKLQNNKEFKRATLGNWKKFFNKEHKILFKEHFGKQLIALGYEKDLNW